MTQSIQSYDTDFLRESFISFIQQKEEFKNFNFDGSALKELVRLLAYDSQQSALQANFLANELNLDSADIMSNVISQASKLGYTPRSMTAARIVVDIVVRAPSSNQPQSIKLLRSHRFITRNTDNTIITFSPLFDSVAEYDSIDNLYRFSSVMLIQGEWQYKSYVVAAAYAVEDFGIPHDTVDTSTLEVVVRDNVESSNHEVYKQYDWVHDVGVDKPTYFLTCQRDGLYHVEFGDGVLAKRVVRNNVVVLSYVTTLGDAGNNLFNLTAATPINGLTDINVVFDSPSFGGSARESKESIKLMAPRHVASQGSCVSDTDYEYAVANILPTAKSIRAWGGEKNNPPTYGYTYIAVKTDEDYLGDDVKSFVVDQLSKRNVGSITPVVVDPDYTYFGVRIKASVHSNSTVLSSGEMKIKVSDAVKQYSANSIEYFGKSYDNSNIAPVVKACDSAIYAVNATYNVSKIFFPVVNFNGSYNVYFNTGISKGGVKVSGFTISDSLQFTHTYKVTDVDGVLVLSRDGEYPAVINRNVGYVDYEQGVVSLVGFTPNLSTSADGRVTCSVIPSDMNVIIEPTNNSIHSISAVEVDIKETN